MHILYLQQELVLPGARGNCRCWEMAKDWTDAGHKVTFVTSLAGAPQNRNQTMSRGSGRHQTIELDGITIHAVDVSFSHMMSFRRRVWSFLEFYRKSLPIARKISGHDLVLAYTAPLTVALLGRRVAQIQRKPLCLEVADVWPDVPIEMGIIKNRWLISWLNRKANQVYADSQKIFPYTEGMQEQILSHGDFASKTHVLHNGANCAKVEFFDRSTNEGSVKVLYAGTIGKANDLTHLLRAIQIIESWGRNDLEFAILGTGNDEERVHGEAERLQLKSLKFLPAVGHEEVPRLLRSADIGISCCAPYPVLQHNGATKFFDYLASGLPIVINYEGWQSEYLREWSCGLYSKIGDDQALARNILQLADHPDQRIEFARNGRRLAEASFDRRRIAKTYLGLLESVVS